MLRTEDISLHDPESVSLREKKASDLHNRAQTASECPEAALVSIHQNIFQQSRYRGTQVFYAPTQGSQELAQAIQGVVRESLQPENSRESKPIPSTVYLMNHIPNRAVLVECGFLSNPEEEGAAPGPKIPDKAGGGHCGGVPGRGFRPPIRRLCSNALCDRIFVRVIEKAGWTPWRERLST